MVQGETHDWRRRDFLAGLALLGAAIGSPAQAAHVARKLTGKAGAHHPLSPQQALMRDVAQLVIPRTTTPGAGEVGVGSFVLLALAHGLQGAGKRVSDPAFTAFATPDGRLDHARWLAAELDRRVGAPYMGAPLAVRQAALAALDADAFAGKGDAAPWHTVKNLILLGYYTSETGGSKELNYEHIPGRWDPDVALAPSSRAYSSDWTAVDFG